MLWVRHRRLAAAILLYLGLMLAGVLWSNNRTLGMHVLGHQWFWLLLPVVFSVLSSVAWRRRFLFSLSGGLILHLGFCVLQLFGVVAGIASGGSGMDDPTGHIGRIGFGFVYGIWAAWLLHLGWLKSGWRRWGAWALAAWAWLMIFLAQGRSGYLIAFVLLTFVVGRQWLGGHGWKRAAVSFGLILLMAVALAAGPGKQRLVKTWNSIQSIQRGDVATAEGRWSLWLEAVDVWKKHPFIGVGTGGYAAAAAQVFREHPEYLIRADHPHNAYLLSMARWGTGGLMIILLLLYTWIRTAWQADWNRDIYAPLISLSGLALAVHALSASSLEEHFSAVLAVLLLGAGLSDRAEASPPP
ncbi:MAG: O-antigen ligase family protein [Mariprofundaceae bacterium]|nr:O-antigen ligase family protein [Mariprofundaceae bacterium]